MARYERDDDGSFWEIERHGRWLTTRIGSPAGGGGAQHKAYRDVEWAERYRHAFVRKREAEGYQRAAHPVLLQKARPELEALIAAGPKDLSPYQVYADWLSEKNARLGKLIALECRLHGRPGDLDLLRGIALLRDELLGHFADRPGVTFGWRLGLVRSLWVDEPEASCLSGLLELDAAATLAELRLRLPTTDADTGARDAVYRSISDAPRPLLRKLELRQIGHGTESIGDLSLLWEGLSGLEELTVAAANWHPPVPVDRLRVLALRVFRADRVADLLADRWSRLEELHLSLVRPEAWGEVLAGLRSFQGPRLHTLSIQRADDAWGVWDQTMRLTLAAQLTHLDLSYGSIQPGQVWRISKDSRGRRLHRIHLYRTARASSDPRIETDTPPAWHAP